MMYNVSPRSPEDELTNDLDFFDLTPALFARFPKKSAALTLKTFDEETASLVTVCERGQELSAEDVERLTPMADAGDIFIESSEYIHLREWVLVDPGLIFLLDTMPELPQVLAEAIVRRLDLNLQHFTKDHCQSLKTALRVLTELVWTKSVTTAKICEGLYLGEVTLAQQSYNSMLFAVATFMSLFADRCTRQQLDDLALGMALHDLGMARIPGFVLEKSQALQKMEWEKVLQHTEVGGMMLSMAGERSHTTLEVVDGHHERLDGSGYPKKLAGNQVGVMARLAAVADSLAAMIAPKPHRPARSMAECLHELARDSERYDTRIAKRMLAFILSEVDCPAPTRQAG